MNQPQKFIDKCFKDSNGRVVIGQLPNYPITVWAVSVFIRLFPLPVRLDSAVGFISDCFLFLWAWWEITSGVNYFRRFLGIVVLAAMVVHRL